jgi:hypothetical protein
MLKMGCNIRGKICIIIGSLRPNISRICEEDACLDPERTKRAKNMMSLRIWTAITEIVNLTSFFF